MTGLATSTANETEGGPRSARKRRAIVAAATEVFLRDGYLGTSMDEIAALSAVSKQTVYKQFGSKEALFIEIVTSMTGQAGDSVHPEELELEGLEPGAPDAVAAFLADYAVRQLTVVLTPRLMQLRRLVIGEVGRFPELAKVLYERGPLRALQALAAAFERLGARGVLSIEDPLVAATSFNWLIMGSPVNEAMLLGDGGIPEAEALRRHAAEGVRVFLAAYGGKVGA